MPAYRSLYLAVFCVCVCFAGCSEEQAVQNPLVKVTDQESAAIKLLRDAGATLKLNDAGSATDVSFLKLDVTADTLAPLADLKSLLALNLADSTFSDESLPALEKVSPQLVNLDLRGCQISDAVTPVIARFTALRALRFSGKNGKTSIGDDGLKALASCTSLKVLALDDLWISSAGLEAISGLKDLEELYLAATVVDDDASKLIVGFPKLKKLRLAKTHVTDAGLLTLSTSRALEELDLSENSLITNTGMLHLGKLVSLKKLNLWRVQISDEGALALAPLVKLAWLNLDNSKLSDGGLPTLKGMTALTFLHLGSTQITEAGAPSLFHLKTLKDLKITRTAMGSSHVAVAELQKNLPGTAIQTEYVEAE